MTVDSIVVIGTGHAGFQLAVELRQQGYRGRLCLVGDEAGPPYQRPPLSKAYLKPEADDGVIRQRPDAFFAENRIELFTSCRAVAIDRKAHTVALSSGVHLDYGHLVLATGARNRSLSVEGADHPGVTYLRTAQEARRLRARLEDCRNIAVIGAGFIGLEFAAVAASRGVHVTVIEQADRGMARAVSPEISSYFERLHKGWGTRFLFGATVARITDVDGTALTIETDGGEEVAADLVLAGVGVVPNTELGEECGLKAENGIVVDAHMATSDPDISAIGDCARHPNPHAGGLIRLESVQNATDQARVLARRLLGLAHEPYGAVPWFWSDQGPAKLQIAGLGAAGDDRVVCGNPDAGAFSVFRFRNGNIAAVESVGRPGDHLAARQVLVRDIRITPEHVGSPGFDLKASLKAASAAAQ
ncbi:NAD(P)/FAD-dependent oxidoreductase [Pelagibacterium halotolerans]|uniref:NAD(P)/FAD-dependent oxidoreductase n=1 Tax=Pelagibacterium halotolerans TaxID=531813 RepID=UPI00384A8B54